MAREALDRNGLVIVARNVEEARAITNKLAPGHLTVDAKTDLKWVENAGSGSLGAGLRSPWAITSPVPITLCRQAAWRVCAAD